MRKASFRSALASLVAIAALAISAPGVLAQGVTTGSITGTVTGDDGRPLAGAQVTVIDTRTGGQTGGLTNANGRYRVPFLQPGGPYTVRAQIIGYRTGEQQGVRVSLSAAEIVSFTLETSAVEVDPLTVQVESNPVFSAAKTGQETTLPVEEISSFPTISRQITSLASLSPHVNQVEGAPSIAGQNNRFNNIQIDGSVNNDVFGLADSGLPGGQSNGKAISFEAIEEFQVLTAPFDVRHSNFSGGLINAVTKSGTNEWSGSAFGFHSRESFVSDLDGDPFGEFTDSQFGWTLGGPLQTDKLFLFTSGEFQINDQPSNPPFVALGGPIDANAEEANIHPDSAARFVSILESQGFEDPGTSDQINIENPRTNIFARLDWNVNENNRAVFRWNYARARVSGRPFRRTFTFAFSSNGNNQSNNTNSFVGQLFSRLNDTWDNELLVSYQRIRDERDPLVVWPAIEVDNDSDFGDEIRGNTFVAGAEEFSQLNSLSQDIYQLTDNLTKVSGDHTFTFGTHNELFSFKNAFVPQSIGVYEFDSLADLEAGNVGEYTLNTTIGGFDGFADWSYLSTGFYAQDNWQASNNLSVSLGLRADIPVFLDSPRDNPDFASAFGVSTSSSPSGNISWQPRLGFNWNSLGDYQTQVRGGIGLFSGRPPYVWLSNAYSNTGADLALLSCSGTNAPALDRSNYPGNAPSQCLDGTTASAGTSFININDPDFDLPLDLKLSLGIDRELPNGWSVSFEALYTQAVNQVFFRELNIPDAPIGTDPTQGDRPLFGTATADGFAPQRQQTDFAHVVSVTNATADKNRAFLLSGSINRRMSDWLAFRGSYTYSDVEDLQSLFSSQATSNFGRTPIGGNPNEPERATSAFEVKHKIVASATGQWDLGGGFDLEVTPQLFANSGPAYSYIARGDLNGDGYRSESGPRISRDNDLIYIPNDVASEMAFRNPEDAEAFEALINSDSCLSEQRGSIMTRNSCSSPFQTSMNLRIVVGIPGGWTNGRAEIVADFLNLFNAEVQQPNNIDRGFEVLRLRGRDSNGDGQADADPNGQLLFDYTGPRVDDEGNLDPYTTLDRRSRRLFQIGLRYRF
ncbi:MAG: carboxypeptidase regulatory-like domain-containing protein [Gemmatimonadetes bacterium]|nr:carboxypeptidase regulatory-like domain-containing protein [Gemmatimonadota bacterium]